MPTLQEMIAQKEALEKQIEEATSHGRSEAIAKVKALMAEHGLKASDLGGKTGSTPKSAGKAKTGTGTGTGAKVAAKYRNGATGETWSGRGLQPRWLKAAMASGKKIEDFAV